MPPENNKPKPLVDLPPQDLESEKALLGSIFYDNRALDEIHGMVHAGYFYLQSHGVIFSAIQRMIAAGKREFDAITVGEQLKADGKLDDIGGYEYLQEIIETVPYAAHAVRYAEIVRERWMRRQAIYACADGTKAAFDLTADVSATVGALQDSMQDIVAAQTEAHDVSLQDVFIDALNRINQKEQFGVTTGFAEMDDLLNGWQPGQLVVLAARPSVGKSAMAIKMLKRTAESGIACTFVSLEQSRQEVAERLLSLATGISVYDLRRSGRMTEDKLEAICEAAQTLSKLPMAIDDLPHRTVEAIASQVRKQRRQFKDAVKLVVIDYLQLIEPRDRRVNREQQVAEMSRGLKLLAKKLEVTVVVLAQLNRAVELRTEKEPRLSDLRESGAIEQDADVVLMLDRPAMYDSTAAETEAYCYVRKHRNGKTGRVDLNWNAPCMDYEPAGVGSDTTQAALGFV